MSPLSFLHPLLQVELVGLGWDRTSARAQAYQAHAPLPPWVLLSFPECHSGNRGHLSNITEQMSGSVLAREFSRLAAQAPGLPTAAASPGYSSSALYK